MKVPMSSPDLTDAEREAVAAVMRTPNLSMGPELPAFEAAMAQVVGTQHAIAVSSGTAALHLCVAAARIGDDDLVITTPFSFVASTNALLYERATPIFVDVDPLSGNLDPDQVAAAVEDLSNGGKRAEAWLPPAYAGGGTLKGLLTVDVFGQPAEYEPLLRVVQDNDLILIEDSSEALGAEYHGRQVGTFGEAGVFAFYPNKQMTTAEGGVVVTDRDDWAGRIRALRNQGREKTDSWLQHTHLGYNYRMHEMSAALGLVQVSRLGELLSKRERVAGWYAERLQAFPGVRLPHIATGTSRMSWFVYVIRLEPGIDRAEVIHGLRDLGIPSRAYFDPIHLQPYMRERFGYQRGAYPVTEELSARCLALPFSGVMTEQQVDLVCEALNAALA